MPANGNSVIQVVSAGRTRVTVTLPSAASAGGRFVVIKRGDRGRGRPIVVRAAGDDRIDATARELRLEDERDTLTLVSDGAEWMLLSMSDR